MTSRRALTVVVMIVVAAMTRLLPHPPNVVPITAMALFGGRYLDGRWAALFVVLGAMALSDCVLGFDPQSIAVYVSLALSVGVGVLLRRNSVHQDSVAAQVSGIGAATLASSIQFFLVTNFGMWLASDMYPKTPAGLLTGYTAAIPFFERSLFGDFFFVAVLFGGYALINRAGNRQSATSLAR